MTSPTSPSPPSPPSASSSPSPSSAAAPGPQSPPAAPGLAWLNNADAAAARAALRAVCAAPSFAERLLAARPFADPAALRAASDAAVADLPPADLDAALAAHPPIGAPEPGSASSAREQGAVRRGLAEAPEELAAELRRLNDAYQERFGHVFLIRATGRGPAEVADALRARLGNGADAERAVVRRELAAINRLRLDRLAEAETTVSTHILDTAHGRPAAGVTVALATRTAPRGPGAAWAPHAESTTDADGRCRDLPALPPGAVAAQLRFAVEPYLAARAAAEQGGNAGGETGGAAFFPEVTATFAVTPGEHFHVPLLLSPFGYSLYRGS